MAEADESQERQVLCSGCLAVAPESRVHVIPYYNAAAGFVTGYYCGRCWLPALGEARTRLAASGDEAEIASAAAFFERHGVFLLEFRRGGPSSVVRGLVVHLLDRVRSGALRLTIGPTRPL